MRGNVDTVEEFWTPEEIEQAQDAAGPESREAYRADFAHFIGVNTDQVYLMPSGQKGLEWLLKARCDARREVMVPAFNCGVVQHAVVEAGFDLKLYDFSPQPGLFDWRQVIEDMGPSVGVLIATHYFGVPNDFRPVVEYCASRGIAIIEDCAHTMGGSIAGQQVGTIGDAAIYSFNYDKPISLGWGGLAVINQASFFECSQREEYRTPEIEEEVTLLREFVATMKMRRRIIAYQDSLMIRGLRRVRLLRGARFRKDPNSSIGAIQAQLGRWCLARYPEIVRQRVANAEKLRRSVAQSTWPVARGVEPAWVKQKLHIPDDDVRAHLSKRLQRWGIRAGNFNWPALIEGQGKEHCLQASEAATQWIDLPVHQNLTSATLTKMINTLNEVG